MEISYHNSTYKKHKKPFTVVVRLNWKYQGSDVQIVGSWNNWKPGLYMKKTMTDFLIYIRLKPGRYEYKFCVDNSNWWYDMERSTTVDPNGNINNVLYITDEILTYCEGIPTSFVWGYNPNARSCEIYGEWDDWESHSMRLCNGDWVILIPIPQGRYQYKYCIDHTAWCYDMAEPTEKDESDNINNVRSINSMSKYVYSISDGFELEAKQQAMKIHQFDDENYSSDSETESDSDADYLSASEDDQMTERERELKKKEVEQRRREEEQKLKEEELRRKEEKLLDLERRVLNAITEEKVTKTAGSLSLNNGLSTVPELSTGSNLRISLQSPSTVLLSPRGIGRSAAPTPRSSRINLLRTSTLSELNKNPPQEHQRNPVSKTQSNRQFILNKESKE